MYPTTSVLRTLVVGQWHISYREEVGYPGVVVGA